jgi:hypothetical protein
MEKSIVDLPTQTGTSTNARPPFATAHPRSSFIDASHPRRKEVENFIARRFLEVHGARINSFMPQLLALFDEQGQVLAAVGIGDAGSERLFLEYYLDVPVEHAIAIRGDITCSRERIVEIGNLASLDRHASRRLFLSLSQLLYSQGYEWAVFTGCTSLQRMFAALGIETLSLGRALQSCLPQDQQTWGSYYEDNPQVVAGRVNCGREVFEKLKVAS